MKCVEIPCNYQGSLPCRDGECRVGRCRPPCDRHCKPTEECNRVTHQCEPKGKPTLEPPGVCPEECPEGQTCNKKHGRCEPPEKPCKPPCKKGQYCNLSSGRCQSKPYTTEGPDFTTRTSYVCPETCPDGQVCNQATAMCEPGEETTVAQLDTTPLPPGKVCFPPCDATERCENGICIPFKCQCESFEECNQDKVCVPIRPLPPPPPACTRLCNPKNEYCNSQTRTCVRIPGCPKCADPLVCDPGREELF
jgi:hypothetical protein